MVCACTGGTLSARQPATLHAAALPAAAAPCACAAPAPSALPLQELAAPVTSLALGRVGLQFFLQDGEREPAAASSSPAAASTGSPAAASSIGREPLIVRLSRDCPEEAS